MFSIQTEFAVAFLGGLISILIWLVSQQVNTNKMFRDAVEEFRVAIQVIEERYKAQQLTCQQHRERTEENAKELVEMQIEIAKIETKNRQKIAV